MVNVLVYCLLIGIIQPGDPDMGRVLTNTIALSVVEETSLGEAGSDWFQLEPNSIGTFGATISTIVRNPISRTRQRSKGTLTDLDSAAEFEHDLVYDVVNKILRGFVFAKGVNDDEQDITVTAITTAGALTVAAIDDPRNEKYETRTLLWLSGFSDLTNNGLATSNDVADGDTTVNASGLEGTQVAASAAAGVGFVSIVGIRCAAADLVDWAYNANAKTGTLSFLDANNVGTAAMNTGLRVGQFVHFGSIIRAGAALQNGLGKAEDDPTPRVGPFFGYARVRSISADSIVFDKLPASMRISISGIDEQLDILFGNFIKPLAVADANYFEQSYTLELEHPDLGTGAANNTDDSYVYSRGNYCNTLALNIPITDKATVGFAFIGTDTDVPTTGRKSGASTAAALRRTEAYNTTADIARLRVLEIDEDGLTTDFKSVTVNLNNNVSPEKALAKLGAQFMNTGEFAVSIEMQCIFTNPLLLTALRNNQTVTMDMILKNNDGVICLDIPGMTLGDGSREYPENESVLINLTCEAFEDEIFDSSFGFTMIPVPLP